MPDKNNMQISPVIDRSEQTRDYLRNSEGYTADNSLGTLIGGAGDLLTMAVKGTDQFIKNITTEEIQTRVDSVRDEALVQRKAAVNLNDPNVPQSLKTAARELQKIDTGRQQGRLRDTYYWARMDNIARSMRARYPGYREHIDNTISSMLGTTPANQLARELDAAADRLATSSNDDTKWRRDFFKTKGKFLPDEAFEAEKGPNPWSTNDLLRTAARRERLQVVADERKTELEIRSAEGRVSKEDIASVYNTEAHQKFAQITDKFNPILESLAKEGVQDRETNGGVNSPDFIKRTEVALAQAKLQFDQTMLQVQKDPAYAKLDRGEIAKVQETYSKLFDATIVSVRNSTVDHTARIVKAIKDNADYLVLGSDAINIEGALQRQLGSNLAEKYTQATPISERISDIKEIKRRQILGRMATQSMTPTQIAREAKDARLPDSVVAGIFRNGVEALKDPKIPKPVWDNIFTSLYGRDGNPERVFAVAKNVNDTKTIFEQWASPAMTQAVKQRNDPQMMERYNQFIRRGAEIVSRRELDSIRDTTSQGNLVEIEWSGQGFVAKPSSIPETNDDLQKLANRENAQMRQAVALIWNSGRLQGLNTVIKNLTPVWKEAGLDPQAEAFKLLGVTMAASDTKPDSGLAPFRRLLGRSQAFQMENRAVKTGITRENLDSFLGKIDELDIGKDDAAKQDIDKIVKFLQDMQITLTERESTNVEDMRPGRFAEPRLLGADPLPDAQFK